MKKKLSVVSEPKCFENTKVIARRLGVSRNTVDLWREQGKLPFIKVGSDQRCRVLFDWSEVVLALKNRFGHNHQGGAER